MNWKHHEREIAKRLNGVRVPVTGRQRGSAPDIAHPTLAIEVKSRSNPPKFLMDAMDQAKASVRGNQTPIVVIHEKGQRHDNDFVVMRFKDWLDWHGPVTEEESA